MVICVSSLMTKCVKKLKFCLEANFDNSSDRIWDNGTFCKSPTSDVSYLASKNSKNLGSQRSQHISKKVNKAFLHRICKGKCAQKSTENQFSKNSLKIILTRIPSTKVELLMKRTHFEAYYDLKSRFLRRIKFLVPYSYFDYFCNRAWFSKYGDYNSFT